MIVNEQEQQNPTVGKRLKDTAKQYAGKKAKKLTKQLAKKLAKKAIMAAGKALLSALKYIAGAVIGVSAPVLIILGLILIALLLIYIIAALIFTDSPESLNADEQAMRQEIIDAAASTVNQNNSFESQFAVPYELLVAGLQILDSEKKKGYSVSDIQTLADNLAPEFFYTDLELIHSEYSVSCVDSDCTATPIKRTPFYETVIDRVYTWEDNTTYSYDIVEGQWEQTKYDQYTREYKRVKRDKNGKAVLDEEGNEVIETYTVTYTNYTLEKEQSYTQSSSSEQDYSKFEAAFANEPFEYGENDLVMVEVIYALTGGLIEYSNWLEGNSSFVGSFDGNVLPGSSVPSEYFNYYMAAQQKYGVDWFYIAAIHYVETKFSTISPMISSVGAEGHTQFMPCTWVGWSYSGCKGSNGFANIPDSIKTNPSQIKRYGGYGTDGNGNGIASPWEIEDALFTTAKYLAKNGFAKDVDKAILSYNHSQTYLNNVKANAKKFREEAKYLTDLTPNTAGFIQPAVGRVSSQFGWRNIGGTRKFHYGVDIANKEKTPIYAVSDGTVKSVTSNCPKKGTYGSSCGGGWGNYVMINHKASSGQYEAVYAHLFSPNVKVGQTVKQGQVIGFMGTSGSSTGVHLHFEIHSPKRVKYTNVINPALIVPLPK